MEVLYPALVIFASLISDINCDYFSVEYIDVKKSCNHKEPKELYKENKNRCHSISGDTDERLWEECKRRMSTMLIDSCPNNRIKKVVSNFPNVYKI